MKFSAANVLRAVPRFALFWLRYQKDCLLLRLNALRGRRLP